MWLMVNLGILRLLGTAMDLLCYGACRILAGYFGLHGYITSDGKAMLQLRAGNERCSTSWKIRQRKVFASGAVATSGMTLTKA